MFFLRIHKNVDFALKIRSPFFSLCLSNKHVFVPLSFKTELKSMVSKHYRPYSKMADTRNNLGSNT